MISKKAAATLGTGALGAAAGSTAYGMGLFENRIRDPGYSFIGSSNKDERVIALNSDLEFSSSLTNGAIIVEIKKDEELLWKCTLTPIVTISSAPNYKTKPQWDGIEKIIKSDYYKRKKFVENCSGTRTNNEKIDGNGSTIEIETEQRDGFTTFKNLEKILTEDFRGLKRLSEKETEIFNVGTWGIEEGEKNGKEGKVTIYPQNKREEWSCEISGKTSESEIGGKTFKKDELEAILKLVGFAPDKERKKYIMRNCIKNNKTITGLTIQSTEDGKWRFDDASLKKISEGMYENPAVKLA